MHHLDTEKYSLKKKPLQSTKNFFDVTLAGLKWNTAGETILDVGCGPGMVTTQLILPFFPDVKKIFAVDPSASAIHSALIHHQHPKIEYRKAAIDDWSALEDLKGQISKVISVHCFHWLKDQKLAFQNIHNILTSGGEAAFLFVLRSSFYDANIQISKDPKWIDFLKDVKNFIPESHLKRHDSSYYKKMLEDIGFTVEYIEENIRTDPFTTDKEFKDFYFSICVLVPHIPDERKEEFKEDLFQYCLRTHGRNNEGLPNLNTNMLELVIKKN